ncbi:MAG: transglutaminase domain-containing protein [Thermoplasmata archaeon]|nr:transglutaminase domain-containing protein [Thermoplasmata archaeon]
MAIKLHDYVIKTLDYAIDGRWDDAPTVLKRGNGSCSEYCFAYIALCRAAGTSPI